MRWQNHGMETRVTLIRHAESNNMVSGEIGGSKGDTGLTNEGKRQVGLLGDRLADSGWHPAAVFTSPLPRAVETAKTIADVLRVELHRHDGLGYRWPPAADGLRGMSIARILVFPVVVSSVPMKLTSSRGQSSSLESAARCTTSSSNMPDDFSWWSHTKK